MNFFEEENVRSVIGGKWLQRPLIDKRTPVLTGVGIDTRDDLRGKIFFAIKGQTHDGHTFLQRAIESGAGLLIVDDESKVTAAMSQYAPHIGIMLVDDTRRALGKLALGYRRTLRAVKIIAVTGSAGKTTTKRLIEGVLSTQLQGTSSPKSFNNDIGLPLTILSAQRSDKYLLVEIGTNAPGEIAHLSAMAEPDIAIITMVGRCHLEGLGTVEAIAEEKASMLRHLKPEGVAILNADVALLRPYHKNVKTKVLFGESESADVRLTGCGLLQCNTGYWLEVNSRHRFELALTGKHNAINALAAIAVGRRMGLDDDVIAHGLKSVKPADMRMTPQQIGEVTIYNDAYNANPESMAAALESFAELTTSALRRVVILGDMLELGEQSHALHVEIGRKLRAISSSTHIHHAVVIGMFATAIADELRRDWSDDRVTLIPSLTPAAIAAICEIVRPGDAVLLKASRGMGLERIIPAIETHFAQSHTTRSLRARSQPEACGAATGFPLARE